MTGKNLLVVGGSGFIGKNIIKFYKKKKFKIYNLSLNKKNLDADVNINLNINDKKLLKNKISKLDINFIIYTAGYVKHNQLNEYDEITLFSHYIGLKNLLSSISLSNLKKIIYIGSSEEYGESTKKLDEKSIISPNTFYGLSKYLSSIYLFNLHQEINLPVTIFRPFLLYGPHQDSNRLIPYLIKNLINNKKIACSSGTQIRDFLHIDDFVKATYLAYKLKKTNGEIFNIASGRPIKIKMIYNIMKKYFYKSNIKTTKKIRKSEREILYADISKAKAIMRWEPSINIYDGIKETINHFKHNER